MIRYFVCISFFIGLYLNAYSQATTYNSAKDSDKKSVAILNKLKSFYNSSTNQITSSFNLKMTFAGNKSRLEKGTIVQSGNKFNLVLNDMSIVNDGKTIWVVNKANKEIQINDNTGGSASGTFNPTDVVRLYDSKKFVSVCTFDGTQTGKSIQIIELKPLDKKTEYSKARITVNKVNGSLSKVELFNKDGSRYDLTINKTISSKSVNSANFAFNKASYPGYNIEDLRIN